MAKGKKGLPYDGDHNLWGYGAHGAKSTPQQSEIMPELQEGMKKILSECEEWQAIGAEEQERFLCKCAFWVWEYAGEQRTACGRKVRNTLDDIARAATELEEKIRTVHQDAQIWIIRAYQDPDPADPGRWKHFNRFLESLPSAASTLRRAADIAKTEAPERGHDHAEALILNFRAEFRNAGLPVKYRFDEATGREPVFVECVFIAMQSAGMQPQSHEAIRERIHRALKSG